MRQHVLWGSAAAMALAAATPASAQQQLNLTIASGHAEVFLWVRHLTETFIPVLEEELARHGEVEINWTEAYGGTLVRLGSEVEAFQQGIMDVGMMSGVFSPGPLGLMNISYAMPFGPTDARAVAAAAEVAMEAEGALDAVQEATGIVYIGGGVAIDDYNIGARHAFNTPADMDGIRIGGAGPNLAWLGGTGAVGVQGSFVSFYNDINTGVYDGFIGWMTAMAPARLYEVAPYWNAVNFGAMYIGGLGVAQPLWESFSPQTQDAFRVAAAAYAEAYFEEQDARYEAARQALLDNDGTIIEMDREARAGWIAALPNPTTAWAQAAEARGEPAGAVLEAYRDYLAEQGFDFVRDYLSE